MNYKLIQRIFAVVVFLITVIVLFKTVQPSVSFWDCGELSAASVGLQVTHPPGAPFFILVNKVTSLIPFAENIGFRVNTLTVIASSFTIMFLFLICVKLIENFKGKKYASLSDALITYISSAVAALGFAFCDTFWWNGVESNVFGFSTFLFSLMVFLALVWNEKADEKGSDKYLLMIAFLAGLSPGVHLMSVPALFPIAMLYVFRRFIKNDEVCVKTSYYFVGHILLLLVIAIFMWASQTDKRPPAPEEFKSFDSQFKIVMLLVSVAFVGIFYKKVLIKNSIYIPYFAGAVSLAIVYPGIVKYFPKFLGSISNDNFIMAIIFVAIALGILVYLIIKTAKQRKAVLNLAFSSLFLAIIGFTTYSTIIIRANQNPPMNENNPRDFNTLVSYLSREQYGDFPTFKRRYSQEPHQQAIYTKYSSDLDFLWRYQINHMFNRYLMWDFVGQESSDQDSGVDWRKFLGIPFLIALAGLFIHFKKDWRMATIFFSMFVIMGYLICFYQDQQQPQPRERIYFYAGAFFTFATWMSIGLRGIIDFLHQKIKNGTLAKASSYGVLFLAVVFIPVNMFRVNYNQHDRSKDWLPWDYAYNMLQSCEPNAILFCCGDNDTFPLWYLQDVEGVRRDIRIANLSLINSEWYIKQLKNLSPYGAEKVAMTFDDATIDRLQPTKWEPKDISIPVPKEVFDKFGVKDTALIKAGKIVFKMPASLDYGSFKGIRVQDMAVRDIIESNKWKRPIYFAGSCPPDNKIGLDAFLRVEGLCERLIPYKLIAGNYMNVDVEITKKNFFEENPGYSKTYAPGFKYRGLTDPTIFRDDNAMRTISAYRMSFLSLAQFLLAAKDNAGCIQALDKMEEKVPRSAIKMDYRLKYYVCNFYFQAGNLPKYQEMAKEVEVDMLAKIKETPNEISGEYSPYKILIEIYENLEEYNKAIDILNRVQAINPNDKSVKSEIDRLNALIVSQAKQK